MKNIIKVSFILVFALVLFGGFGSIKAEAATVYHSTIHHYTVKHITKHTTPKKAAPKKVSPAGPILHNYTGFSGYWNTWHTSHGITFGFLR